MILLTVLRHLGGGRGSRVESWLSESCPNLPTLKMVPNYFELCSVLFGWIDAFLRPLSISKATMAFLESLEPFNLLATNSASHRPYQASRRSGGTDRGLGPHIRHPRLIFLQYSAPLPSRLGHPTIRHCSPVRVSEDGRLGDCGRLGRARFAVAKVVASDQKMRPIVPVDYFLLAFRMWPGFRQYSLDF